MLEEGTYEDFEIVGDTAVRQSKKFWICLKVVFTLRHRIHVHQQLYITSLLSVSLEIGCKPPTGHHKRENIDFETVFPVCLSFCQREMLLVFLETGFLACSVQNNVSAKTFLAFRALKL